MSAAETIQLQPDASPALMAVRSSDLLGCIRERLKQHRDNLALWKSGALRPTVEDDDEQCAVMHDLCVAIAELETVLMQSNVRTK